MSWPVRHISRSIAKTPAIVSAFLDDKRNLPKWAAGLSAGLHEENGKWISDSPMGKVEVRFAPQNDFGVFDHDVILPNGESFHNPLRVLKNDDGSEVVFTLYRRGHENDEAFEHDAKLIETDLETLRGLLE
ncbi:MAG: SRPBCC family protein [Polyangiaceae bacterium]